MSNRRDNARILKHHPLRFRFEDHFLGKHVLRSNFIATEISFVFRIFPSRFRQSVIAPLRHLTNTAETPLQSSRGCEEVSLSPTPSSRPICQIGFKPHESLWLCHRRAARFIAPAWISCMLMDFSPRASLQSMSALFDRRRLSGFHHRPSAYL